MNSGSELEKKVHKIKNNHMERVSLLCQHDFEE